MKKVLFPILAALILSACANANSPAKSPAKSHDPARAASAAAKETSTPGAPAPSATQVQQALASDGIQITGTLKAPPGYEGFVASYQGHQLPVYALPDGKHIMVGTLFDLDGHDLTGPEMQKLANSSFGEAQWKMLESASWVVEGNPHAKHIVYEFVDTRCPFCHQLWEASQPWLKKGNVQVRNILVGVITPESLPEAANILDSKDPSHAWTKNEANFGKNPTPADHASATALNKVRANTELMQKLGFMGTPGVVWKDAKGQIHTLQGMPRNPEMLKAVFGAGG